MMRWHMKAPGTCTEGILPSNKVFLRAVLLEMPPLGFVFSLILMRAF